jgi:integrase
LKRKNNNKRTVTITKEKIASVKSTEAMEMKIADTVAGFRPYTFRILHDQVLPENTTIICEYITSMRHEVNPSDNYREDVILLLAKFSLFFNNQKAFKQITREDLLSFLDRFRKSENADPLHKWIGTYNIFRIHLMRFFKWLYSPEIEQDKRSKPSVIENISQLKRKEKSIYRPTDLWTTEDDQLFLKYCPSTRDKCYHAISRDSAARPHELLKLRLKDVVFKLAPDKKQYAEISVNGKTGTRSIPLINCIPYVKDWINQHPQSGNPNGILLSGFGRSLGKAINERSLGEIYRVYRFKVFPKLLDNCNIPLEDKNKIKELLKKPWNPYIRRHSALTEKSGMLKEHYLRQYAGWTPNSNMHLKYLHYFGNESSDSLLEASGIIPKDKRQSDILKPKQCPNCNEPNKPDSKFCAKCRMVLTYDAYSETLEDQKEKEDKLTIMEERFNSMQSQMQTLLTAIVNMKDQNKINEFSKTLFDSGIVEKALADVGR